MIENEEKVECIFRIAEQQGGLPWRRGILPILVVSFINWVGSFPMQPLVVRGPEANNLCNLTGKAKLAWNEGATLFSSFKAAAKATVHRWSVGTDNPGIKGCLTFSFELPDKFISCLAPEYIKIRSKALLATKGPWFTCAHIEWGGSESIAKLESGRKIWIFASTIAFSQFLTSVQSFNHLYRLLVEPKTLYSRRERMLIRDLRYHLAEPGDVIIQPPCYAHCVLTGRSLNTDGTVRWALAHGWEGINVNDQERANRVFGQFSSGAGKGLIRQWLDRYGLDQLMKLLEVREWRVALQQWKAAQFLRLENPLVCSVDSEEPSVWSFFYRRDVLEHCEAFQAVGYDLNKFLRHSNPQIILDLVKRTDD